MVAAVRYIHKLPCPSNLNQSIEFFKTIDKNGALGDMEAIRGELYISR